MATAEPYLSVRALGRGDIDATAALLGRGMADNPVHRPVYGGDDALRQRRHAQLMRTRLTGAPALRIEGVEQGGELVGVAASSLPGLCQPSVTARMRLLGRAMTFGPATASRLLVWKRAWARHDPGEPHVHLGPVSVDRHLRGRGIGSLLMLRHAAALDAAGAVGFLETDRPEAVGFYERFGYVVVGQDHVLGVPCWFMRRPAL